MTLRRRRLLLGTVLVGGAGGALAVATSGGTTPSPRPLTEAPTRLPTTPISPIRARIVALVTSQIGYRTNPSNTYCNKFSAYFYSGARDCPNANLDEQWCADFAAWAWKRAGVGAPYAYVNGDLNASSASFYEWGLRTHRWHPLSSHYRPQPGDVAVYGLEPAKLYATHVAVVVGYTTGDKGPTAVNGDGDRTGFSVVELARDEYHADAGRDSVLSGYVSPL